MLSTHCRLLHSLEVVIRVGQGGPPGEDCDAHIQTGLRQGTVPPSPLRPSSQTTPRDRGPPKRIMNTGNCVVPPSINGGKNMEPPPTTAPNSSEPPSPKLTTCRFDAPPPPAPSRKYGARSPAYRKPVRVHTDGWFILVHYTLLWQGKSRRDFEEHCVEIFYCKWRNLLTVKNFSRLHVSKPGPREARLSRLPPSAF